MYMYIQHIRMDGSRTEVGQPNIRYLKLEYAHGPQPGTLRVESREACAVTDSRGARTCIVLDAALYGTCIYILYNVGRIHLHLPVYMYTACILYVHIWIKKACLGCSEVIFNTEVSLFERCPLSVVPLYIRLV